MRFPNADFRGIERRIFKHYAGQSRAAEEAMKKLRERLIEQGATIVQDSAFFQGETVLCCICSEPFKRDEISDISTGDINAPTMRPCCGPCFRGMVCP